MISTTTNNGLHGFVAEHVLSRYAKSGMRAVDLGTGPGAMAARLQSMGCSVVGADRDATDFAAGLPHVSVDFDQPDFASAIGKNSFQLVTAIEVIEHVESPIGFLRNIGWLLAPGGVAVLTTPNVDCLPARIKFFLQGRVRAMDARGEPTHISPIFWDLLKRQLLPRAGVQLREHLVFPPNGYQLSRKVVAWSVGLAATFFRGEAVRGDNHILVVETIR